MSVETLGRTFAGIPVELIEPAPHMLISCESCFGREATQAVGAVDHTLVCDPCLAWGDRLRRWNLEPRQKI